MQKQIVRRLLLAILMATTQVMAFGQVGPAAVFDAFMFRHLFIIQIQIDGEMANMLVDTGSSNTIIWKPTWQPGTKQISVGYGPYDLKFEAYVENMPIFDQIQITAEEYGKKRSPVVGIIGLDVLRHFAVGFDYSSSRVTCWANGNLPADMVSGWIKKQPKWPGNKDSGVQELALTNERGVYLVSMHGPKQIEPIHVLVDSGSDRAWLCSPADKTLGGAHLCNRPVSLDSGTFKQESLVAPIVTIGGVATSFWNYCIVTDRSQLGKITPPGDGAIGLMDFRSRCVLMDIPAGKVNVEKLNEDARLSIALTQLLNFPLRVDGSKLMIAPYPMQSLAGRLQGFVGDEILTLGNVSSKDIFALARYNDKEALKRLGDYLEHFQAYPFLEVMHKGTATKFRLVD